MYFLEESKIRTIEANELISLCKKYRKEVSGPEVYIYGDQFKKIVKTLLKANRIEVLKALIEEVKFEPKPDSCNYHLYQCLFFALGEINTCKLFDFVKSLHDDAIVVEIGGYELKLSDMMIAFLYRIERFDVIQLLLHKQIEIEGPISRVNEFYYIECGEVKLYNNALEWTGGYNHQLLTGLLSSYALQSLFAGDILTNFEVDLNWKLSDDIIRFILNNNVISHEEYKFFLERIVGYIAYYGDINIFIQYATDNLDKFNPQNIGVALLRQGYYEKGFFDLLEQKGFDMAKVDSPSIYYFNTCAKKYNEMLKNLYVSKYRKDKVEFTNNNLRNIADVITENGNSGFPDGYIDYIFDNLIDNAPACDYYLDKQKIDLSKQAMGIDLKGCVPTAIRFYAIGRFDLARKCVEKGFSLDFTDKSKKTLFLETIKNKDIDGINRLINLGVNLNFAPVGKEIDTSPLMEAIKLKTPELVTLFLKNGADPEFVNKNGESALLLMLKRKEFDSISEDLIKQGIKIDFNSMEYIKETKRLVSIKGWVLEYLHAD